jgi:hypothetical protein
MSNVNIRRAVQNIKTGTTVYSPLVEVIVNGIEAIEDGGVENGKITISVERSKQLKLDGALQNVESFEISDNGVGFTDENRESFDTLYSDKKAKNGGKGFGRFVCLKYFDSLKVISIYQDGDSFKSRTFFMGKNKDIIVKETISPTDSKISGSTVRLSSVKAGKFPDKKLQTIARSLVEKLLPYFISKDYVCPLIVITEKDEANSIVLNDSVDNELSAVIKEIEFKENTFMMTGHDSNFEFNVRIFKFYSPKKQKSKISLVAHRREVTDIAIHNYVPEFIDEFYDKIVDGDEAKTKNYIIKAYVFGTYLDDNVSFERGGFEFQKDNDLVRGVSQSDIENRASIIAKKAIGEEITVRQEKKKDRIYSYVDEQAPWHRDIIEGLDTSNIPYNPSNEEIESRLQKEKFKQEVAIRRDVAKLLSESDTEGLQENVTEIVRRISETSKNDLVHYVAMRRNVLDIFKRSLELDEDGKYSSEGTVHDIIFPRKGDSDKTSFEDHNLWIVDERLNFTDYVASDLTLNGAKTERPDLLVYDKRVAFRGDNEQSNPVIIFEFKKPQRDDFVNHSSNEDPVQQIIRYVNSIRNGDFKTPKGRDMLIANNTPFYGYVVCDLTKKVKKWLEEEKDFKPMPDGLGWYQWREKINLYIEVLSWDKVLKDASMRNKIFFHKLGIS